MKYTSVIVIAVLGMASVGCAYNQSPVVDMNGVGEAQYQQDYAYCEQYAQSVNKEEAMQTGAANGAVAGTLSGAIVGAFDGNSEDVIAGALAGAIVGTVAGTAEGALSATDTQALVLRQCLRQKGYKVYDLE